MSREERRAYRRMTKNVDPYAMPTPRGAGAKRVEKVTERRQRAQQQLATEPFLTLRFLWITLAVAAVVGLLFFSIQWPNMPFALYVGIAAGIVSIALATAFRIARRRGALSALDRRP
jgi:hypothetical protein